MKDNFSFQSDRYAKFRPFYPVEFFDYLDSILTRKEAAWDCGTGNGQIAVELSGRFENVFATDISPTQVSEARKAPNVHYSIQPAEQTEFENDKFEERLKSIWSADRLKDVRFPILLRIGKLK